MEGATIVAKTVLIVDDEPDILELAQLILEGSGHEILTAGDGDVALRLIRDRCPDLVLLDLGLPTVSGAEVCKEVKKDRALKNTPVILFTASEASAAARQVRELEADDYMVKPFRRGELSDTVKRFLG